MKPIRCTCCGTELTAPQFYNGYPYGYTCVKRFEVKPVKNPGLWVVADKIEISEDEQYIYAWIGDIRFKSRYTKWFPEGKRSNTIVGGLIKLSEYKNGHNTYWRHVNIISNHDLGCPITEKRKPIRLIHIKTQKTILEF